MQWESGLVATWLGLLFTIGGVVYAMGKQSQKIENLKEKVQGLESEAEQSRQASVKLAALETDIKYLVQGMQEIKSLLIKDLTGVK
jgi:FtsZ-binding cell division protein ZapB